jgi:hypothetical protein
LPGVQCGHHWSRGFASCATAITLQQIVHVPQVRLIA